MWCGSPLKTCWLIPDPVSFDAGHDPEVWKHRDRRLPVPATERNADNAWKTRIVLM